LSDDCNNAGIPTEIVSNIMAFIWGKVLYNSALNPLGAILGVAYGKLGENEETKLIMEKIIREKQLGNCRCAYLNPKGK